MNPLTLALFILAFLNAGSPGLSQAGAAPQRQITQVRTGIDVLEAEQFAPLAGLRLGLITNQTGLDSSGRSTIDLLQTAPGVTLAAVFSPEHGLSGRLEGRYPSVTETISGIPVYSLYGRVRRPTEKMLEGLDALVFDIQGIGARFFTYHTTMGYAMEAAAARGLSFFVLDRPNPITASIVQGPVMDADIISFTGYFPLPVRHGMTIGELATLFNAEKQIGVDLRVIGMEGYRRGDWYDETGLAWVSPSPNLLTLTEAVLYPGVAMVEGANVSVGRGTPTPFELVGAPWIRADDLSAYLNGREVQGVRFIAADFIPEKGRYKAKTCHGVRLILTDRRTLNPAVLGLEIAAALYKLFPREFLIDKTLPMIGSKKVLQAIKDGCDPHSIAKGWQKGLEEFTRLRSNYLLY